MGVPQPIAGLLRSPLEIGFPRAGAESRLPPESADHVLGSGWLVAAVSSDSKKHGRDTPSWHSSGCILNPVPPCCAPRHVAGDSPTPASASCGSPTPSVRGFTNHRSNQAPRKSLVLPRLTLCISPERMASAIVARPTRSRCGSSRRRYTACGWMASRWRAWAISIAVRLRRPICHPSFSTVCLDTETTPMDSTCQQRKMLDQLVAHYSIDGIHYWRHNPCEVTNGSE